MTWGCCLSYTISFKAVLKYIYIYLLLNRKQSKMKRKKKQVFKQAGRYKVNKLKFADSVKKCNEKIQ